ncbi:MAG TPA: hypothetical protein DEW46_11125, partial [Verrucomicrobia bacterium]|nr:hypothetical protein [Verrucomicrobiota bacterium]
IEIGIGIVPCSVWRLPSEHPSNIASELGQHRNSTIALPGFLCPNPITRPFDTDPERASPSAFS